jgi:ribonucleotide reductase alpha subunit
VANTRQRRKLVQRDDSDWEAIVKRCLHKSAHTANWGCLDKKCKLFRIADFKNIYVPKYIVENMVDKGVLTLSKEGYYKYNPIKRRPKKKKKKLKFKRRKLGVDI